MTARTVMCAFAFAAAGFSTACDKTPTAPTPDPGSPPGPAVVRSLEITGPDVVPLGATAQFRLTAHLSDGTTRDFTSEARWHLGWGALKEATNPGEMVGIAKGEALVSAFLEAHVLPELDRGISRPQAEGKEVLVLPAGTYRLMGTVVEAGTPTGPIYGALVEVITGSGIRMTTEAYHGQYAFYGVSGETSVRATKDGYQPVARTAVITAQTADFNLELPLLTPRAEVSGNYTLTVRAADECRPGVGEGHLPEEARVRTYQAEVRQHGPRLEMTLSGATLRSRPILGRIEPGRAVFELGDVMDESDTDVRLILDKLATSGFLAIGGVASVTGSADRFSGALGGIFQVFDTESNWSRSIAWCSSERHQFVLSR